MLSEWCWWVTLEGYRLQGLFWDDGTVLCCSNLGKSLRSLSQGTYSACQLWTKDLLNITHCSYTGHLASCTSYTCGWTTVLCNRLLGLVSVARCGTNGWDPCDLVSSWLVVTQPHEPGSWDVGMHCNIVARSAGGSCCNKLYDTYTFPFCVAAFVHLFCDSSQSGFFTLFFVLLSDALHHIM
jgi:hypothetical protein